MRGRRLALAGAALIAFAPGEAHAAGSAAAGTMVLAPLVVSRQVIRQEVPITALTLAILAGRASFGAAPGRGA